MICNGKSKSNSVLLYCEHIHALTLGQEGPLPWSSLWRFLHGLKKWRSQGTAPTWSLHSSAEPTQSLLPEHMQASFPVHPGQNALQVYTSPCLRGRSFWGVGLVMQTGESTYVHTRALLAKVKIEMETDPGAWGEEQANLVNSYLLRLKICQGWPPFVLLLQALQCCVV